MTTDECTCDKPESIQRGQECTATDHVNNGEIHNLPSWMFICCKNCPNKCAMEM